ncbi:uncharacterized protein BYT42DRAFT_609468 [Radiomyces spectabilis]|uniref:uncharacterized protein n=1 Tax=Radiomyces spectabilis TaxID=64574 RepID=UPI00221FCFA2|nr:uncharacterized protein BYT42DRAFT_609468 [Radiomyces spectabilis]KAI8393697.1 hypothetical protein BYT42DRAFT_609468 [Radiomyces spectabilis]
MAKTGEAFLRIGDEIILYDENNNVLIAENPLETRACVRPTRHDRLSSEAIGSCIFRIEPQQWYTEKRALKQFFGDDEDEESIVSQGTIEELQELRELQREAHKEQSQNETERKRLFGKPVLYGQVIQLYSKHFRKYLTVTGRTCKGDISHLQVNLSQDLIGYFKIMPRYRIRVDGEPVRLGDTFAIQCVRPEGYLNVGTNPLRSDLFSTDYYEVFSHTRISSWTMKCHASAFAQQGMSTSKFIHPGQYVRFYHKEMEAYLESPMLISDRHDVRLRKHVINPLDPKESDSPLAFWEIENADSSQGSKLSWKKPVRIRHAASRRYLYIDPNNVRIDVLSQKVTYSLRLVKNPVCPEGNDGTLFKLIPASDPVSSRVPFGSYVRIQHVASQCWIHAADDDEIRRAQRSLPTVSLSVDPLTTSPIPHSTNHGSSNIGLPRDSTDISTSSPSEDTLIHNVTASQDFYYHDCFSITLVNNPLSDTFIFVNELLPRLQWFIKQERKVELDAENTPESGSYFPIDQEEFQAMCDTLSALIKFCTRTKENDPTKRVGIPIPYHQVLLRDIGVIEAVISMIQIPFDLGKRRRVRTAKDTQVYFSAEYERAVPLDHLQTTNEYRLKTILSLCYHLLRVFLIEGPVQNEPSDHQENQLHVLHVAGDDGIHMFQQHMESDIGVASMMIQLVKNNTAVIEHITTAQPQLIPTLVDLVKRRTQRILSQYIQDDFYGLAEGEEIASFFNLLSALCHTETSDVLIPYRHYVSEQLFGVDPRNECLFQTRLSVDAGIVEVKIMGDSWRNLESLVHRSVPILGLFVESVLHIISTLVHGSSNKTLESQRQLIPKNVCLKCIGDPGLPSNIRAQFCHILRVLYVEVSPFSEVLLPDFTLQFDTLCGPIEYPSGGTGSLESRCPEFFDQLKHWALVFLDDRRHLLMDAKPDTQFLSAVLKLIFSQLRLGFFTEPGDVKRLFRALVHVLDGRIDARNIQHLKHLTAPNHDASQWNERYLLSEDTLDAMNTKIQILEIFDLIFDLRLHVRMAMLASEWKRMESNTQLKPLRSLHDMLTTIYEETLLRQRENILMPILKDILRYQYAPLKRIAVVVMHRIYNDSEDLFQKTSRVMLLTEPQQVFVYHGIKKRLAMLRSFLASDRLSVKDHPAVDTILQQFIGLFNGKTIDFDDSLCSLETTKNQRNIYAKLFKNLNAHPLIITLLTAVKNLKSTSVKKMAELCNEQDTDCIGTMKLCLDFLVELTQDDPELQGVFILQNLDLLIDICAHDPTLAVSLYGLCRNNLHVSVRMREEQIKRILELSKGYHGEYLHLLHDAMKARGKLIKRNQDCVMRLMMDRRSLYVPFDTVYDLTKSKHLDYCIALIELLAVCGQGDNTYGQSFARTVFSIHDIAMVLQDQGAPVRLKTVMLRFLSSIYLDNIDVPSHEPVSDNRSMRMMIEKAYHAIVQAEVEPTEENQAFVYNGVLVFLRSVFEYHISFETTVNNSLFSLCPKLVDRVVDLLQPAYGDRNALQNTLACLDSMINVSGFRGSVHPEDLRDKLRDAMLKLTDATNHQAAHHDPVNVKFQGFVRALKADQGVLILQRNEFKKLGSHFNLIDDQSVQDVKSLIDYLSMMTSTKYDKKTEHYQVATMKILEEIPLQYIRERWQVNAAEEPVRFETLEKKKAEAQNILNGLGCTLVTQTLLSSPRRQMFEASLKLLIALLEGGNKNVQDKLEEYFYSIREERFFYSFHQRLRNGIASLEEAQLHLVRAAYKMNRQQSILSLESVDKRSLEDIKKSHRRHSSSLDLSRSGLRKRHLGQKQMNAESVLVYQKISNLMANETAEFGTADEDFASMKDTMRALQLMVEGHNINLQTYLAKQPDNIKSFNIVQDVVEYLHAIVPLCNIQNVRLIIQVLDTITELAQGCLENQLTIFNDKIINPVNTILREPYPNCPRSLVNELKSKVVICLLSLLEGSMDNSEVIFQAMAQTLDLSTVLSNMNAIYDNNRADLNSPDVFEKLECGFLYCMLMMTLWPALDEDQRSLIDQSAAFNYFQRHTGKIEVVMDYGQDKQLMRVLFPIPEVCKYLRDSTKQRFLWNVKRDSPSTKIEDLVQQSGKIIYEIENQARVAQNRYLSLLTKYSHLWWKASYVATILLNALMLVYSSMLFDVGNANQLSSRFTTKVCVTLTLEICHLVFWLLSTAEFYFIQLPILVYRHSTKTAENLSNDDKATEEKLAIEKNLMTGEKFTDKPFDLRFLLASLFETQFLYHLIMVGFSVLGLFYPGFYAVHLLDFVFRDRILQGVIASITLNVSSISRTALLGIIVVYIHSVVAYMYFRSEFDASKGLYCDSLSECFVTVLSHGVRSGGGIGDILEPDEQVQPRGWRTIFEMSFYLIVVVFLLNAIFGIIFDTFGHLRDERSAILQDMKTSCFICSINAVEFQRHAKKGFEDHVKNDHNIWQYLFFIVHLKNKDRTEYTGPESYVAGCLKDMNYSFFPINRALCLRQHDDDDTERLLKLEEMTSTLMERMSKIEESIEKLGDVHARSRSNSLLLSPM